MAPAFTMGLCGLSGREGRENRLLESERHRVH